MRTYRALLLRYDVERLPPEIEQKVAELLRVQAEFRAWAAEWAKNSGRMPLPERSPLKYSAPCRMFIYPAALPPGAADMPFSRS
jgi:hypothetical protein